MKRLIVTADDFGASPEVNDAVEQAHRDGILTATSLMVAGNAAADAVARARALPTLGVGLHIVLVEGRPVLPADNIPALVDATGNFRSDMARAGVTIFTSPAARAQLAAEIEAQFAAFAATGLTLDHVNAHKHFHLHPTIAGAILRIGQRYGMRAARAPVEPRRLLRQVDGTDAGPRVETVWARLVRARLRRAGMLVPDQVFGLAWSGAMTADRVRGILERLPDGLTEIYTHPATSAYPGSAPGYDYRGELAALVDPLAKTILTRDRVALGRFADFA
ncbi:hopanoid biosynthesis-associated protein HpnK [Sphingomonas mali]|uniref:hopanoid biosynthesis-associated protein HpnK n=1 Tax=Sphingomonas mali TaxID=40682 RepID=UPI00082F462E|nr:hopanoid biosynthesis-associated protein HpnK [Sphingomonas mali]